MSDRAGERDGICIVSTVGSSLDTLVILRE